MSASMTDVHHSASSMLGSSSSDKMRSMTMYACASQVQMPQIGDDDRSMHLKIPQPPDEKLKYQKATVPEVSSEYLKKISTDITFADEVVEDRCLHMMPYSDKYFLKALDISDIVSPPPKSKYTLARYNTRGTDKRHQPCHIKNRSPYKLKPIKRKILERAKEMHQQAMQKEFEEYILQKEEMRLQEKEEEEQGVFFLTQKKQMSQHAKAMQKDEWDKYLMSLLSDTTAQWIVAQKTEAGVRQVCRIDLNKYSVQ